MSALLLHLPAEEEQPPARAEQEHFFVETEGAVPVQAFGEE